MTPLRGATLFSGIGAPECSAPWIDWRWGAEIDPFASAVHAAHFPDMENLGDVRTIDASRVAPVDVIVFGSPCQGFSVAGKRGGLDDDRSALLLDALRLIERIRPRWLVFENVPGLLSNWSGAQDCGPLPGDGWEGNENSDFAAFLGAVRECGYLGCWRSLDAQFAGLAQRRERVFFIGYLGDWRPSFAILFEPESLSWHPAPSREAGQGTSRPIAGCTPGGSGYRNDADTADNLIALPLRGQSQASHRAASDTYVTAFQSKASASNSMNPNGVAPPIDVGKSDGIAVAFDAKNLKLNTETTIPVQAGEHGYSLNTIPLAFGGNNTSNSVDLATACNAKGGSGRMDFETETLIAYGLDCKNTGDGGGNIGWRSAADASITLKTNGNIGAAYDMSVRRLTPTECERLMGYPDDYTAITYRGKPAADGPRYRALGNSMAVPVVGWILHRITMFEALG